MGPGIKNCCICGKEFTGYGHSPRPVMDSDFECCDECNFKVVTPARIRLGIKKTTAAVEKMVDATNELNNTLETMNTELERIKAFITKRSENMEQSAKIELLHNLAWWASEEAGRLDFESEDVEDYD